MIAEMIFLLFMHPVVVSCAIAQPLTSTRTIQLPPSIIGGLSLSVDSHTNRLLDSDSRERYFHGSNVVFKAPPYHPQLFSFDAQYSFCDDDMELMQSMGYNSIRLSVPWSV